MPSRSRKADPSELRPTGERLDPSRALSTTDRLLLARHIFAYNQVSAFAKPPKRVVDIGCGTGYGTGLLSDLGFDAIGIDVEEKVLRRAIAEYGSSTCTFVRLEGDRLPIPTNTADIVVAFQVIEHVPRPDEFLAELRRIARPGSLLLLTTPNRDLRLDPGERPWNRYHLREYDVSGFASLFRDGFASVIIKGIDADPAARAVELDRVATLRRLARLDPFRLRKLVPQSLIGVIAAMVRGDGGANPALVGDPEFFVIDAEATPLDLFAIATVK